MKMPKIRRFKDMSIFFKMSFCFGLIILLMIILSLVDFLYYQNDKDTSTISVVKQMNLQAISETDNYVQNILNSTKTPLFYDSSKTLGILDATNLGPNLFSSSENSFTNIIESIFSLNKQTTSVFIFNLNGDYYDRMTNNSLSEKYDALAQPWFKQSILNFGTPVIIPTFQLSNLGEGKIKSAYVFGVARGLVKWESSKVVGVILVNSSINVLANMVNKLLIYPNQRIIITNKEGYTIYDTIENNIAKPINDNSFNEALKNTTTIDHMNINGTESLISSETSNSTDWKIINIIPINELNKSITTLKLRTYLLTFIFVMISLIFVIILAIQIISPINRISKVMRIVENGDFDVKVKIDNKDELGHLSNTFNIMTKKIKSLINEVYIDKINKKDLELQMLQNQINPHFIYNTLESIRMMAEINNDKETSNMAYSLGTIIRYSLSGKNNLVTVEDEIKNLEIYVKLQKIRMENIEDFIIDVDKSLYKNVIIKLIFQPLIENAIYHGMDGLEEGGIIQFIGHANETNMVYEVIDNGNGMDKDKCIRLNAYINDLNEDFSSIGLRNVNMRIKLHYSSEYGIEIFSEEGVGTRVKIVIPFKPINNIE